MHHKKYKKSIPDEIKILFGKFYFFSFIYLVFFFIVFPHILKNTISLHSSLGIIIVLSLFYIYIIMDVHRKKENFSSTYFLILIGLVIIGIMYSINELFLRT